MKSISLENQQQLQELKRAKGYSVIFKHNTSCPISKTVRSHFEKEMATFPGEAQVYFLDLLSYRDLSNAIAENFSVNHESPQMLVIKDGECCFHQSLYDISVNDAANAMNNN
jgi:bacillithiol system protein YtxJ